MWTERLGSSKDLWDHLNRGNNLDIKIFAEYSLGVADPFQWVGICSHGQRQQWDTVAAAWPCIKARLKQGSHAWCSLLPSTQCKDGEISVCSLKNVTVINIRNRDLEHTTFYYYGKHRAHRDSVTYGVLGQATCFFHETLFFLTWTCLIDTLGFFFFSDLGIWQT